MNKTVLTVLAAFVCLVFIIISISFIRDSGLSCGDLGGIGNYLSGTIGVGIMLITLVGLFYNLKLLQDQIDAIRIEQFDNTFFHMMDIMDQILNEYSENGESGHSIFNSLIYDFNENHIADNTYRLMAKQLNITEDRAKIALLGSHGKRQVDSELVEVEQKLTPYVHHISMMVSVIMGNVNLDEEQKKRYLNILYSRLSVSVIGFLKTCIEKNIYPNETGHLIILFEGRFNIS